MNNQIWQVKYLITEFYPEAVDAWVDEVEERVYFSNGDEGHDMQAHIDRDNELIVFQYQVYEDWYFADSCTFDEVNVINQGRIF